MKNQTCSSAFGALLAAATIAAPGFAGAQQTAAAVDAEAPTGFRMGSGRLNASLELQSRYDSMAGYVDDASAPNEQRAAADMILDIKPGLSFIAPSNTVEFGLKAAYTYQAYTGMEESALTDQSKSILDLDAGALFNKEGNVRVEVADKFARSDRPSNLSLGAASISNRNDAQLRVSVLEKGAWSITPSYVLTSETFESIVSDDALDRTVAQYDYVAHTGRIDARYEVFGKSALMFDGSVGQRTYTNDDPLGNDVGNVRVGVGLTGLLTQKLGYTVKGGYGTQFGLPADVDGFGSMIGNAELAWFANEGTEVRAGYLRSFEADPAYEFYADDRVYLTAGARFGSSTLLRAGLSYDSIGFGADADRTDGLLTASIAPSYAFNRWFEAGVSYAFTSRTTDGKDTEGNSFLEFDRHELGARVAVLY